MIFFLPQTEQFYKSICLFCLVFLTLEFSLAVFFWNWIDSFLLFLYNVFHRFFISFIHFIIFFYTLFTETASSWLIYQLIKALEIRPSIVFDLPFRSTNTLSCLFFFFFIIDLYFLIPAVIAKTFIPTAKLVMSTETQNNDANAEIKTQPAST